MKRKICVITGSRSDYGLLHWLMRDISSDQNMELQIIATGTHLSPEFGLTRTEIEEDGFTINTSIEILLSSDTPTGIAKSMGLGLIGFADAFHELKPDLIVVLGDRFEIFSAVSSALVASIPVAHLHGGEVTEGAFDDAFRHAITKMSHLHFVAHETYRQRVIQLGENPDHVFTVGGIGIDGIIHSKLLDRVELEIALKFKLGLKNLLITFHPSTVNFGDAKYQLECLLDALDILEDTHLIFTMPNADAESRVIIKMIEDFVANHENARAFYSLGQLKYLSCIKHVDGVVGNSSSGILEVPSFKKGTINIGDRQCGRIQANSIINCKPSYEEICASLIKLYSKSFQSDLEKVVNPYGDGGTSKKILKIIKNINLQCLTKKLFFDQF
jgi:GDP/UDP-N,N'-diacetylbacillosamine 2-epimerase (hydrolysing)